MGSQEVPTGPAVEMYLRCNHDDCKRIDWRTVHGLQCHIVKNHGQPKGTIGSLEKALAIYGVPLNEVAEFEKNHGLGSAGQMADPKNQKIKIKTREAMQKKRESCLRRHVNTDVDTIGIKYLKRNSSRWTSIPANSEQSCVKRAQGHGHRPWDSEERG